MADPAPAPAPEPTPAPTPAPSPAPTPAPAPNPTPSLLNPDPAPTPAPANGSAFGDTWRQELATGEDGKVDEKFLEKLNRYKSPKDFGNAHRSAVEKILQGTKHEPLPANATPEQLAAWRKDNGIPEQPDGYLQALKLPDGIVIGEDDKPRVNDFLKKAHEANASPTFVNAALSWYYEQQEAELDARAEADRAAKAEAEENLRELWGPDFKTNINVISGMIDTMPEGARDLFKFARLQDGTPLGANAEVMNALAAWARQLNPIGTVVPIGTGEAGAAAQKELDELRAEMGNPKSAYWLGPDAARKQARFAELTKAFAAAKK